MAKSSIVKLTIKEQIDGKEQVRELNVSLKELERAHQAALRTLKRPVNLAAISMSVEMAQNAVAGFQSALTDLSHAYAIQEQAETQLATVMRQRMNATDNEIQKIKELASAQQSLGIIGDEVQLSGAQQLSTFLTTSDALNDLIPAMNNLLAQQKGINATNQDAVNIGNLMGKAMQGQVAALKRVGITFTDAQAEIMKYGTEAQRAAMLAQIITANVGDMNAELAKTPTGRMKQLSNTIGDLKEKLGKMANSVLPFTTIASQATTAVGGVVKLTNGVKSATAAIKGMMVASRAASIAIKGILIASGVGVAIAALTTALEMFESASGSAAAKQKRLTKELKDFEREAGDLSQGIAANSAKELADIDILMTTIKDETKSREERNKALRQLQNEYPGYFTNMSVEKSDLAELETAYNDLRTAILKSAEARAASDKLAENFKEIDNLKSHYTELQAQAEELKKALHNFESTNPLDLGAVQLIKGTKHIYDTEKALEKVNEELAQTEEKIRVLNAANKVLANTAANGVTVKRNTTPLKDPTTTPTKKPDPVFKEDAATLAEINDNIAVLEKRLQSETTVQAAETNKQIQQWRNLANAIKTAGIESELPWHEHPKTLKEISDNIAKLDNDLQNVSSVEVAAKINEQKEALNTLADSFRKAGKAAEDSSLKWHDAVSSLKDIDDNIAYLRDKMQNASFGEIEDYQSQIESLEKLKDSYTATGEASKSAFESMREGFMVVDSLSNAISGMTKSLSSDSSAWEKVTSVVKGFFAIYEGVAAIVKFINMLTTASAAHTTVKVAEGTAVTATSVAQTAAAAEGVVASSATVVANKIEAASFKELAAAKYMAAHASIPFAGYGIGAGFTTAMLATVAAAGIIPFADGGIVYGPTMGLFGEYAGASRNPEIVAPLDKLRDLIEPSTPSFGGLPAKIKLVADGRSLVGVLELETLYRKRGG